jgi:hypothetical protein
MSRSKSCKRCICQVTGTKEIKGIPSIQLGDNPFMLKFPLLSGIIYFSTKSFTILHVVDRASCNDSW